MRHIMAFMCVFLGMRHPTPNLSRRNAHAGHVLVRRAYAAINASDINYTAGRRAPRRRLSSARRRGPRAAPRRAPPRPPLHDPGGCAPGEPRARAARRYFGSAAEAEKRLPFDAGFEAVGVVAAVGPDVEGAAPPRPQAAARTVCCTVCAGAGRTPVAAAARCRTSRVAAAPGAWAPRAGLLVGDAVAQMAYGAFSEWGAASARHALRVPSAAPEVVALLTSGLTASIGAPLAQSMPLSSRLGAPLCRKLAGRSMV